MEKRKSSEDREPGQGSTSPKKQKSQDDIDSMVLDRVDRRKKKKAEKLKAQEEQPPELELMLANMNTEVRLKDVKDLFLWVLADGVSPKWIMVKRKMHVKRVAVIMVSELDRELFDTQDNFLLTKGISKAICPIQSPGDKRRLHSPIQALFHHTPLKDEKKKPSTSSKSPKAAQKKISITLDDLVLSPASLIENLYPTFTDPAYKDFIAITEAPAKPHKILALDCEMCRTQEGLELTRISIVNMNLEVVFDTLVVPHNPILDYNTRYSGITYAMLKDVKTTLEDVQEHLRTLLSPATILVGHSLENDFRALKLVHGKVIDTALIYSHTRGPPFKASLRWLCEKYLNKKIQDQESGHNSIEDAISVMELVKLKLQNGIDFGVMHQDYIKLAEKLEDSQKTMAVVDTKGIVASIGQPPALGHVVGKDAEVAPKMIEMIPKCDLTYGRMISLESYYRNEADGLPNEKTLPEIVAMLDKEIASVYQSLPPNTLFILLSGQGKSAEARKLLARKSESRKQEDGEKPEESTEDLGVPVGELALSAPENGKEKEKENVWTFEDELLLERAIREARKGMGMFHIKT